MDGDEVVVDKAGAEEVERRTVYKLKANVAPTKGEKRDDFIKRFMADEKMVDEYEDEKQRYAVAQSYWRDHLKSNAELPDEDAVKKLLPEGATLIRFGTTSIVYLGKDGVKGSLKYVRDDEGGLVKANHACGLMERIKALSSRLRSLGGPGSGNFGHAGRPGEVGGSSGGGGGGGKIGSTVSFRTPEGWTRRGKIVADLGNRVRIETPEGDRSNVLKSDLLSPGKSQLVSAAKVKIPKESLKQADVIKVVTVEDAEKLPGFLGRTIPAFMKIKGFHDGYTVDGKKTLFVRDDVANKMGLRESVWDGMTPKQRMRAESDDRRDAATSAKKNFK